MPTRFWFPLDTLPDVNPPFQGAWGATAEALRRCLVTTKGASAITVGTQIDIAAGAGSNALDRQYTSARLAAGQQVGGRALTGQLMVREYATTDNVDRELIWAGIVSADGQTLRTTLLSLANYGPTLEFINNATHRNKTLADGDLLQGTYVTVAGDRLVFEFGPSNSTAGTTPQASAKWGENATDLPVNETQTADGAGWIEISGSTLVFLPPDITGTAATSSDGEAGAGAGVLRFTGSGAMVEAGAAAAGLGGFQLQGSASSTALGESASAAGVLRFAGSGASSSSGEDAAAAGVLLISVTGTGTTTSAGENAAGSGAQVEGFAGSGSTSSSGPAAGATGILSFEGFGTSLEAGQVALALGTFGYEGIGATSSSGPDSSSTGELLFVGLGMTESAPESALGTQKVPGPTIRRAPRFYARLVGSWELLALFPPYPARLASEAATPRR